MEAPQFFTTTIIHEHDHTLRWHFVAAPRELISDKDPFEHSPEVVVTRASLPFVMASLMLETESFGLPDPLNFQSLSQQVELNYKPVQKPEEPTSRAQMALAFAESILFSSHVAFNEYQGIEPLSLINPEHSKIAVKSYEGRRFVTIQGPRGTLFGVPGASSFIERIWEELIKLM